MDDELKITVNGYKRFCEIFGYKYNKKDIQKIKSIISEVNNNEKSNEYNRKSSL